MFFIYAVSSLHYSQELLTDEEKKQFLPHISAVTVLSLNRNTVNPQKNLANLLSRAPQLRQIVVWHEVISNTIASHHTNNYSACSTEGLIAVLKEFNINAFIYCQRRGIPDIKSQLISSGVLVFPITKFLMSKKKRKAEPELMEGCQEFHQDSQLDLKSLRMMLFIAKMFVFN